MLRSVVARRSVSAAVGWLERIAGAIEDNEAVQQIAKPVGAVSLRISPMLSRRTAEG